MQLIGKEFGITTAITKNTSGTQVKFTAQEIQNFDAGAVTIILLKQNDIPLAETDGGAGGEIAMTLRTNQTFTLTN